MGIQPDVLASRIRNDQLNALRRMQDIGDKGGMDDAAIAAQQQAGMGAARQNQADTAAIGNKMRMRGVGPGSGA